MLIQLKILFAMIVAVVTLAVSVISLTGSDSKMILNWISSVVSTLTSSGQHGLIKLAVELEPIQNRMLLLNETSISPIGSKNGKQAVAVKDTISGPTYTNSIHAILAEHCLHCHVGPFRNMANYKAVKLYVDNGLLESLVKPGGQMHRFANMSDTKAILNWIQMGAPY